MATVEIGKDTKLEIARLTARDAGLFAELVPAEYAGWIGSEDLLALGALVSEGERLIPAGVLCASHHEENRMEILWLYVADPYHGREIGDELLDTVFEDAKGMGISRVTVRMTGLSGEPAFPAEEWFTERGFLEGGTVGWEWSLTAEQLKSLPLAGKEGAGKEIPGVVCLRDLTRNVREQERRRFDEYTARTDIPLLPGAIEEELSCVYEEDGEVKGGLIVQRLGGILYPTLLSIRTKNAKAGPAMIRHFLQTAVRQYPNDTVNLRVFTTRGLNLIRGIAGEIAPRPVRRLAATETSRRITAEEDLRIARETETMGDLFREPPFPKDLEPLEIIYMTDL